ncbi:MAG: hypothetical protein FJ108_16020 [Deltaproteobacteria bacterium]|nr:hypothetical protein [Deltaproteobacteria bacterium]
MGAGAKLRGLLIRVVAIALGLGFGLVVAEVGLRIAAPQEKSWLDIYRVDPVLPLVSLAPDAATTVVTGESTWHVRTDARGHRTGNAAPAAPGSPTLLLLGDSFAFGHGVDYEESFAALVAQELGGGLALVNTGVPGFGPVQYRQVLESTLESGERPKLILLSLYLGNDFLDCVWNKRVQVVDGVMVEESGRLRTWMKFNLHTYRLASKVYQRAAAWRRPGRSPEEALFDPEAWRSGELSRALEIFSQELGRIGELAREANIPILAVVIPRETTLLHDAAVDGSGLDYGLPNARAATALSTAGIPFVDLSAALRELGPAQAYFARDGHLTRPGNRAASAEIAPALRELIAARPG